MREYIDYEFSPVKVSSNGAVTGEAGGGMKYLCENFIIKMLLLSFQDKISFDYDIEKIIDDWILMGFLVGNDFIPHLPHLHINHDALPLLYRTYMAILPELGGKKLIFLGGWVGGWLVYKEWTEGELQSRLRVKGKIKPDNLQINSNNSICKKMKCDYTLGFV